jgi:hypothetical protein
MKSANLIKLPTQLDTQQRQHVVNEVKDGRGFDCHHISEKPIAVAAPKRKSNPEISYTTSSTNVGDAPTTSTQQNPDSSVAGTRTLNKESQIHRLALTRFNSSPVTDTTNGPLYNKGQSPYPPYIGCSTTVCHILKKRAELCCLRLREVCEHNTTTHISGYDFKRKPIILAAEYSNRAIYNFIVPLRSANIPRNLLYPILIVFEKE